MSKITAFEFFTNVQNGTVTEVEKTYAEEQVAKILADRKKASDKRKKKSAENAPIKAHIMELLTQHPLVASEIGSALEISTSKASSMCRQMVEDGVLTATEVKSPTSKSKVKQYSVVVAVTATATDEDEDEEITEEVGEETAE